MVHTKDGTLNRERTNDTSSYQQSGTTWVSVHRKMASKWEKSGSEESALFKLASSLVEELCSCSEVVIFLSKLLVSGTVVIVSGTKLSGIIASNLLRFTFVDDVGDDDVAETKLSPTTSSRGCGFFLPPEEDIVLVAKESMMCDALDALRGDFLTEGVLLA